MTEKGFLDLNGVIRRQDPMKGATESLFTNPVYIEGYSISFACRSSVTTSVCVNGNLGKDSNF